MSLSSTNFPSNKLRSSNKNRRRRRSASSFREASAKRVWKRNSGAFFPKTNRSISFESILSRTNWTLCKLEIHLMDHRAASQILTILTVEPASSPHFRDRRSAASGDLHNLDDIALPDLSRCQLFGQKSLPIQFHHHRPARKPQNLKQSPEVHRPFHHPLFSV